MTPASTSNPTLNPADKSMNDIVALCKRRGFVYPASEIYGGINGFWDYGPLGTTLKNNLRDHWWKHMVECPPIGPDGAPLQIVGLDSSIIQNPKTWEASGHVGGFSDPMVDCRETKARYRADHLWGFFFHGDNRQEFALALVHSSDANAMADKQRFELTGDLPHGLRDKALLKVSDNWTGGSITYDNYLNLSSEKRSKLLAPGASKPGSLTEPREFNLMFESHAGAIKDDASKVYLRPETAQGIFLNYKNVVDTMRVKMPFGIAQIGKSFRNEVTPRNFIFRSREFEQMEMEWFCAPDEVQKWYAFWKQKRMEWWESLGINPKNLRFRDHDADELAHYSDACVDVEYRYPFTAPGFGELEGIAHRGCFDLTAHQTHSKTKMQYFDQAAQLAAKEAGLSKEEIDAKSKYIPHVIEPASGLTRAVLVMLCEAYTPDENRPSKVYMKFPPKFAPIKAGIFPLVNKDGMPEVAQKLYMGLREKFACEYDVKQNIGKRYARMDEVGTPFCFTIDGQTLEDNTVTVRDRDTLEQQRIHLDQVETFLAEKIG